MRSFLLPLLGLVQTRALSWMPPEDLSTAFRKFRTAKALEASESLPERPSEETGSLGTVVAPESSVVALPEAPEGPSEAPSEDRGSLATAPQSEDQLLELMSAFRPCGKCETMERVGGQHDGGYPMCAEALRNVTAAYSYGINTEDRWGSSVSSRFGVPVHQFDCFTEYRPVCSTGEACDFRFSDECLGPKAATVGGERFQTLGAQLTERGHAGLGDSAGLLLKMDIEGSEWEVLADPANRAHLQQFSQIVIEFHKLLQKKDVKAGIPNLPLVELAAMRNLLQDFAVVHVHGNNCCGSVEVGEYSIPWVLEATLVRRNMLPDSALLSCEASPVQEGGSNYGARADLAAPHLPGGEDPAWKP